MHNVMLTGSTQVVDYTIQRLTMSSQMAGSCALDSDPSLSVSTKRDVAYVDNTAREVGDLLAAISSKLER